MTPRPHLPETSHAAYRQHKQSAASHHALIWDCLKQHPGGLTCEQISICLSGKLSPVQVNRCVKVMREKQLIDTIDDQRKNRAGNWMRVWFSLPIQVPHG